MSEKRYEVPVGVEIATQWAWRLLIIAAAGFGIIWLLGYFSEITVPLAIALLVTALTVSAVDWLQSKGVPRAVASLGLVIGMLAAFIGLLALVGQQLSTQVSDLRVNVVEGITQIQDWATDGPLNLSDSQLQGYIDQVREFVASSDSAVLARVTEVGTTLTHVLAGFFIALFAAFFFLYDGNRIWSWFVAIFPRNAREKIDSSGQTAWLTLTKFVQATVIVALVDALGIAVAAWALGVPLSFAIGVLVFLGAFVPVIGAFVSGLVAVLVALVAQGPVIALFMLIAVVVVQQVEAHVLQPFLMGRFVSVHPLAIILAIAAGVAVAGVVGALVAVPLAACLNVVVHHLVDSARPFQSDPEADVEVAHEPQ